MGRPSKASRARAKERRHKWQNSSYLPPEPVQPTITEPVQPTITEPVQPTITEPVQASLTQYAEHPMNHAIIIILAHGCIMTSVDEYIQVPRCVVDFEKKNVTACGFLSMLDLYYRYNNPNFMLGNIIKHGLKDSFPQPSDVYALREGHENFGSSNTARDSKKFPKNYANNMFGRLETRYDKV